MRVALDLSSRVSSGLSLDSLTSSRFYELEAVKSTSSIPSPNYDYRICLSFLLHPLLEGIHLLGLDSLR